MTEQLHFHFSLSCIGEGNGNPLQCSCLENPRDGGAWWAAVYGVEQSWTWLKRLSSSSSSRHRWGGYGLQRVHITKAQSHQEHHLPSALESKSIVQWSCEGQVIKGHTGQALHLRALVSTNTNETFNTFQSYWKCKRIEGGKTCCIKECNITEMDTNIFKRANFMLCGLLLSFPKLLP